MDSHIGGAATFDHSFALIDAEGRLTDWNQGFEQEWHSAKASLKRGMPYKEFLREALLTPAARAFIAENLGHPDAESFIEARLEKIGATRFREYEMNGRIIAVEERVTLFGSVERVARDVTSDRHARADLAKLQHHQKVLVDTDSSSAYTEIWRSPEGWYSMPPINAAMQQLLCLPAEALGADGWGIVQRISQSEEELPRMRAALDQSALSLEIYSHEFSIKDGNDRLRWMRHSLVPRREPDGRIVFSGVLRDLTRAKDAEDAVELLRSVVVRSFDSVVILESSGDVQGTKVLYVNPKFEQLYHHTSAEIVGGSVENLEFMVTDVDQALTAYESVARGDQASQEVQIRQTNGDSLWVETRADIIQRLEGGRYRWVMIGRDVTERRHALDDLLQAKEAAEAGNRVKSEFLATMSHELRTPLNAIIGFSELIEIGVARDGWNERYLEYIRDILRSGRHLSELVNAVLDLSKIESGLLRLNLGPVDLDDVVRKSVSLMSGLATSANVRLAVDGTLSAIVVTGDRLKIKQVMLNILSNAIKFTPQGGNVTVKLWMDKSTVTIAVTDTGCGILPSDLSRVTEPFVQIESSMSRRHDGTGLGLAIAKQICRLHHGDLEIDSIVDQGTTVRVTLPRTTA